ncbi:PREDICTED: uncharacterized protein LOC108363269 isoform X1 [Rhagoletis zephyria]|uniref:uncharacterized protein LOC108363269 isoform X1 n=2 Tax=Rhagoletis zephyria TaxID=28612 RepID=UPI000811423A|nr:PREDICTED: uncharacterized protein LOC108363269 isoform X1 [Rhagoletis zephyria]XP_017472059.1 PREDICTED: uncharacterized protein LOC108363269 isoform X1 [Rhagoletis zephyria]
MSSHSDTSTQIYKYHSIRQMYAGDKLPDLQLTLREYSKDSVEIEVTNLRYGIQRWQKMKHICTIITIYIMYSILTSKSWLFKGHILCDLSLFFWFLYRIVKLFSLIQSEKVLFCSDLALQCHTVRFLSRTSNLFIPANNVYDVVINEAIEDLDVHYVLIIRTKGDLYQKRPIIAIFNTLRPTFDCLHMVNKCLNKARRKASTL